MRDDARRGGAKSLRADPEPGRSQEPLTREPAQEQDPARDEEPLTRADEPLRLIHHHPGYLRIRAGAFVGAAGDSPTVASARTAAETVPGFRSWSLNPTTGSVVIQYEPGTLEADDLLKCIAKGAGFAGVEMSARRKGNRRELVSAFLDGVQDVNRTVAELTGERADLRELVPLGLVAISIVSFIVNDERSRLPHWFGAMYRSYRVFMHWHRREVRTRERVGRQTEERRRPHGLTNDPRFAR